jgi:hypothetical protein
VITHDSKTTSSPDERTPNGAATPSRLYPFNRWLKAIDRSRATGWRWRINGYVETVNIRGRVFISRDEIERFESRACAGEFARPSTTPEGRL